MPTPTRRSSRGSWIAAVVAVLVIAGATVGIIALSGSKSDTTAPPTSTAPSFALTQTYPSLVVTTDTAKAADKADAQKVVDSWVTAINARDEDGMRSSMCSVNGSMDVLEIASSVEEGTMKATGVTISGSQGQVALAFTNAAGKQTTGAVPLTRESSMWKICFSRS